MGISNQKMSIVIWHIRKLMLFMVIQSELSHSVDQIYGYFGNTLKIESPKDTASSSNEHTFDSEIVDMSISPTGSIAVLLSNGSVYFKDKIHDFSPLSFPSEDFLDPLDFHFVPQLVLFGGDFSLLACYYIRKRMVALIALETVCFE